MIQIRLLPLAAVLFVLVACAPAVGTAATSPSAARTQTLVAERLFFGREIPTGGSVSEEEWSSFLDEVVTPRFPAGMTVWRAEGQWLDPPGVLVREPVVDLEIFHPGRTQADAAIEEIAREYKRRFRQDAVLRVTTSARVHFFE